MNSQFMGGNHLVLRTKEILIKKMYIFICMNLYEFKQLELIGKWVLTLSSQPELLSCRVKVQNCVQEAL